MGKWSNNKFFSNNKFYTQVLCLSSKLQGCFRRIIIAVFLFTSMSGLVGQDKNCEKKVIQNDTLPSTLANDTLANDSVDIAGFRVSLEEAKIYEGFLKDKETFASEEQMIDNYKKRITRLRERKLLAQQLAEAKREEAWLDQDNEATKNEEKKIDLEKAEIERKYEELKQQLFQAREKKLGRPLTNKEKEEILDNTHKKQ